MGRRVPGSSRIITNELEINLGMPRNTGCVHLLCGQGWGQPLKGLYGTVSWGLVSRCFLVSNAWPLVLPKEAGAWQL